MSLVGTINLSIFTSIILIVAALFWIYLKKDKRKIVAVIIYSLVLLFYLWWLHTLHAENQPKTSSFWIPAILCIIILVHIWYSVFTKTSKTIFYKYGLFPILYVILTIVGGGFYFEWFTDNFKTAKRTIRNRKYKTQIHVKLTNNINDTVLDEPFLRSKTLRDCLVRARISKDLLNNPKLKVILKETHETNIDVVKTVTMSVESQPLHFDHPELGMSEAITMRGDAELLNQNLDTIRDKFLIPRTQDKEKGAWMQKLEGHVILKIEDE